MNQMTNEKSIEYKAKLPKGYNLICIAFIFVTILELLTTYGEGYQTINLGFFTIEASFVGTALCKAYIYNLCIYGLMKNKLWGLLSTTLVSFCILIFGIRSLISYIDSLSIVITLIFGLIFVYLSSITITKLKNYLEI